ncbi:diguanylate cyclase [Radiobacillus sp. PE A8.2]|uniref:sensor domain-containing diguanylate cyclase n=1 Tax=Radiobacillus sp. PE A8.2 TaxID=3380349 RepID=UPI00388EC576
MKNFFYKRKFKLTPLLTGLVSLCVIFTFIVLLFSSYQSEKETLTNTYLSSNFSKSNKISSTVDSIFRAMRLSLIDTKEFLANHEEMTDDEIQEQLEILRKSSRYFNSLSWIDETGIVRNIAPISVGLKGDDATGITKEVLESKKQTLTSPYVAQSGRLIVLMSEPLYDKQGTYKGMIAGSIYLQEQNVLNQILGNDIVEENGSYYYVVGPSGSLLFHPDRNRIGEDVTSNPIVQKILKGISGKERVTNTQGISMLAAYSAVLETGWGVVQQTPVSYVNEVLLTHIKRLIIYMLPPFFIILFIAIIFARKLAQPFIELANVFDNLVAGKSVSIPENKAHWNREADILTKSVSLAIEEVKRNNNKLTDAAMTDPLTGIPNRRKLNEVMERWSMDGQLFTLVAIDADHFKLINDTYGHQAGDDVLKFLVQSIQSDIRRTDSLFRYGGEEFVLLLQNTTANDAYKIAEDLRTSIADKDSPVGRPITISLGISVFPIHTNSIEELFRLADKALYQSKLEGRNKTTVWSKDQD